MKLDFIKWCALALLATQTVVVAQRTEVSVQKGMVIAETDTSKVAVDAGRKAVLEPGKNPFVTVDDPMVDHLIEIHKWTEQEKQAEREPIGSTAILIYSLENKDHVTFASLMEFPNGKSEPSNVFRLGQFSPLLVEPKFYDLDANLLNFELEKLTDRSGYYHLTFSREVQPGEIFKFISVSKANNIADWGLWKEGPLWNLRGGNNVRNCLNYYRVILPQSAIFVDANRPVTMIDSYRGRVAVTVRNFTGLLPDAVFQVAFLWPDNDGSTMADLPPRYRGLRDPEELDTVQTGRLRTAEILRGKPYNDQSSPLASLLSLYSAIVHKDKEALLKAIAEPDIKEIVQEQFDEVVELLGENLPQMIGTLDFLGTPPLPELPGDGHSHPVYLCRTGSLLCEATLDFVYHDAKWHLENINIGGRRRGSSDGKSTGTKLSREKAGLSDATYVGLNPGRFMTNWLFLGAIYIPWQEEGADVFPDDAAQKKNFENDSIGFEQFAPKVTIHEKDYEWGLLTSDYGTINLTEINPDWFITAYAWAQIEMPEETSGILGIGSDDGVKVWLNGELIHQNWALRGVVPDNDRVPVTFKKGKNQLVLKIQNAGGDWGFCCRLLESIDGMTSRAEAREVGGVDLPETLSVSGRKLNLNGAGVREKFFIDIYSIGLYLKNKSQNAKAIMEADEPMALRMHIVSGLVTPERMANNVNESFTRSTGGNITPIKDRKDRMISVFESGIKEGDIYDLVYMPDTGVKISKNGKVEQTIAGLDFKKALFGIWIANPPLSIDLKEQLLGK